MKNTIFLPKRIRELFGEIYNHRVTIICAPDGTGKTTLLRAFLRCEKHADTAVRFISSARSTGECFSEIMRQLTGGTPESNALTEPLSDVELAAAMSALSECPYKDMLIVADCPFAIQTILGNFRCAKLFSQLPHGHFVFVGESLKPAYLNLAKQCGFGVLGRDQLRMTTDEIAEYSRRAALGGGRPTLVYPPAIYSASHGGFLGTRLCFMLAERGESFSNLTDEERLIKAVICGLPRRAQCALIIAASVRGGGKPSESLCADFGLFPSITECFGTPPDVDGVLSEMSRINDIIPLAAVNRRKRSIMLHPILRRAAYSFFFTLPKNVGHDLRICFAREHRLRGDAFSCFCEYALAEEYELAGEIRPRGRISYTMMTGCKKIITGFVQNCPPECKAALPRLLRMTALLMHTDAKPLVAGIFDRVIDYLKSDLPRHANDRGAGPSRQALCYAYALKANESMYSLDKMGTDIMRAYEFFDDDEERREAFRKKYEPPMFPWSMGSPSALALIHRRGNSLKIEAEKFSRYQGVYSEILDHGSYMQSIFAGELRYYRGDIEGGLEILSATAKYRSESIEFKMAALYNSAKCCLSLGDYIGFFDYLNGLISIERSSAGADEANVARLYIGMLRTIRGGGIEDSWYALSVDENDPIYNPYTAPYFAMTKAAFFLSDEQNERLIGHSDKYIAAADRVGNEIAAIKLRFYSAQAFLSVGSFDSALRLFNEAIYETADNDMPTVAAEICAAYPEMFEKLKPTVENDFFINRRFGFKGRDEVEKFARMIGKIQAAGEKLRRGIEVVRTYEITRLSSELLSNRGGQHLGPLKKLVKQTEEQRIRLGLTEAAYSYAVMAASGATNEEISRLLGVSIDSVKSSLKRTCASLGIKSRRCLKNIIPSIKS